MSAQTRRADRAAAKRRAKASAAPRQLLHDGFDQPHEVTTLDMAFGTAALQLMPPMSAIPEEFKRHDGTKWNRFQAAWFFKGLRSTDVVTPRADVPASLAWRHLKAIQSSWEPKHEHKEAAVAWLASRWFADVEAL